MHDVSVGPVVLRRKQKSHRGETPLITYQSFAAWVKAEVLPTKGAQVRLDGWTNGKSNRDIDGRFKHHGRTWEVHGDTRIEMVIRAYDAIPKLKDPLVAEPTRTKARDCLNLDKSLRTSGEPKHFYVYETARLLTAR